MFTGIIEEVGTVIDVRVEPGGGAALVVRAPRVTEDARPGDSICVDGACLTVVELPGNGAFGVDVMPETLRRTRIGVLTPGSPVNLERSVRADARLHGHVVQGHVDGVGVLRERRETQGWVELEVSVPRSMAGLVAQKGAVSLNGVSLTITHVGPDSLGVALIPATLAATNLGGLAVGDPVNIEADVVARYVARLMDVGGEHR